MLIKDKRDKSVVLNLDLVAVRPERLRVDVTTTLGIHLATFVMNNDNVTYVLVRDKKYFRGKPGPDIFKAVMPIPLDPRVMLDILFDLEPTVTGWQCQRDSANYLATCRNTEKALSIEWKKRDANKRVLLVSHPEGEMQLFLSQFRSKVEVADGTFVLEVPSSFSRTGTL